MFDEQDRLSESDELFRLLEYYVKTAPPDRESWQDRLMLLEGIEPASLARLHGELIAYDWVEQNTGSTPVLISGAVAQCYRITPAGQRAFKRARVDRRTGRNEAVLRFPLEEHRAAA